MNDIKMYFKLDKVHKIVWSLIFCLLSKFQTSVHFFHNAIHEYNWKNIFKATYNPLVNNLSRHTHNLL